LLVQLRKVYDSKQIKEVVEIVETYNPVRTQQPRKQWRKPPST